MSYQQHFADAIEHLTNRTEAIGDHKPMWDLLVALRGIDEDSDQLPYPGSDDARQRLDELTNHRIRYFTGLYPPRSDDKAASYNDKALSLADQKERNRLLNSCRKHFANHYWKAVEAIRDLYGYDLEKEQPVDNDEGPAAADYQELRPKRSRARAGRSHFG